MLLTSPNSLKNIDSKFLRRFADLCQKLPSMSRLLEHGAVIKLNNTGVYSSQIEA